MPVRGLIMRCPGHLEWVYMDCVAKGGKATEEIQWSAGKWLHKEGARPQWVPETQKKLRKWCLEEGRIPKRWDKNLVQEILPEGRIINRVLLIEGYLHIVNGIKWVQHPGYDM